ncbi:aromatic ring-hydroxylating dioxygenase subunit alpha [Sphingobium aromaticiconvertens]|uniref:aromatic ring-hydroxylating oxygenase subunit alpha n=1 Tax=Sphingobium aromaticiconvertens TaxID=365341 RepID=UPI00301793C1
MMRPADTSVSLDEDVVARLIDHVRNNSTDMTDSELHVPIDHFVSVERAQAEIALMRTLPLIVGHVSEIKTPGDFITREILGVGLLITRQDDGSVVTYRNMCKHRGGRVEQKEAGRKRIFMCRYHGWSYNSEGGTLRPLPYEDSYGPIDRDCTKLDEIRTEVHHGLIFIDLSGQSDCSVADYLGPEVNAQIAPWGLDNAVVYLDKSFTLPINWKLVMDGAIDSLHAQFLHPGPGNVGARTLTNIAVFREFGRHGKLFQPRTKLKALIASGEDLGASSKYVASLLMVYPNAMVIGAPDHVEFWTVWPSANPSECTVKIRFLVRPEILNPDMEARINKSWEILSTAATNEDWPMEVWIQENANAWPSGTFRYGRNEVSAQHLHHQLARDLDQGV